MVSAMKYLRRSNLTANFNKPGRNKSNDFSESIKCFLFFLVLFPIKGGGLISPNVRGRTFPPTISRQLKNVCMHRMINNALFIRKTGAFSACLYIKMRTFYVKSRWHSRGQRFDPAYLHQTQILGNLVFPRIFLL